MKQRIWKLALAGAALNGLIGICAVQAQNAPLVSPAPPAPPAAEAPPPAAAPATSGAAEAAPAPKKVKKKPRPASTVAVTVRNSRSAELVELQAAASGTDKMKKVLGKLKPGKQASAQAPRGKDCLIDVHATFDDGQSTEASGVDACRQKLLNLTD
jgi:hypothetical protein